MLKVKSISVIVVRILLGLIYFVFGLNFFLHFIPTPPQAADSPATVFAAGLFQSGYFFEFLKTVEVIGGLLLTAGLFVPLVLVILMPITLNILLFHAFLAPDNLAMPVIMLVFHLYLAWAYRGYFKGLFAAKNALIV